MTKQPDAVIEIKSDSNNPAEQLIYKSICNDQ